MLLLLLLLFFVWSMEERLSGARAAGAAIVTARLVYTIPLNLYPVAAVMTCQGAFLIATSHAASRRPGRRTAPGAPLLIILSCAAGVALAALLFIPLYGSMARTPT